MENCIAHFQKQLSGISSFGGVNDTCFIENIKVGNSQIKYMASVSGRGCQYSIRPFDVDSIKMIEKACNENGFMGYIASKNTIVINVPVLDNEEKLRITKLMLKSAEDAKVSIRNIRRKLRHLPNIDDITKSYVAQIDSIVDEKLKILKDL